MRSKFYISTKEDKVGTIFAVAKYSEEEFRKTYISKVASNGNQAFEDIVKYLINEDKESTIMTFKFKSADTVKHMVNKFFKDEEMKRISKENHYIFYASPTVFTKDADRIHRADSALDSYLILRDHYIKSGKIK